MSSVAVVDYGMGNIFSIQNACAAVGLEARCTDNPAAIAAADAVILPGIGAFGDAMDAIRSRGLVEPILSAARSGKSLLGICLGMQLLMGSSDEFGHHPGLGILPGDVVKFPAVTPEGVPLKVPHVGWTALDAPAGAQWDGSLLDGIEDRSCMYFVHSYYVRPMDPAMVMAESTYGGVRFCSALQRGNVMGCQFHPERSAKTGLHIYHNLAAILARQTIGETR